MSPNERYAIAEEQLKSFTRSKIRTQVMLSLLERAKSSSDLSKETGTRNTTILHAIKDMSDSEIITKTKYGYDLTNLGKMQAYLLDDMINFVQILEQYRNFWKNHDITGIPPELISRMGMLAQSEIIEGNPAEVLKTQEYFISELSKAKMIQGVSPIIVPGYPEAIATALTNGAKIDLILTKDVLNIVTENYSGLLNELLKLETFRLYQIDTDVTVAFTLTDRIFSLGLFRADDGYDVGTDLNCIGDSARKWGSELFEYYLKKSEEIKSIYSA